MQESALPLPVFIKSTTASVHRVRGTSVFLSTSADTVPAALLHNLKHNQVLHERVLILNVKVEEVPHVPADKRVELHDAGDGFYRVVLHYGFMEEVDIPRDLAAIKTCGEPFNMMSTSFFLGRQKLIASKQHAGHGAVAREAVRLDAQELGKRDGILQAADQPRGRARQPAADLGPLRFPPARGRHGDFMSP